jgi:hypothetical protein
VVTGAEQVVANQLHAARLVRGLRVLDDGRDVRRLEEMQREHRLDHHVGVGILGGRAIVVDERALPGLVERLAGADRLDPHLRIRILQALAHQPEVERAETLERPQRVNPSEQVAGRRPDHLLQRGHHRPVLLQDQQLLRGVAPPAIGMRQP